MPSERWSIHIRWPLRFGIGHVTEGREDGTVIRLLFVRIIHWHGRPAPPAH